MLVLLAAGCIAQPVPSSPVASASAVTCREMQATYIPTGYSLADRQLIASEGHPAGIRVVYLRPGGTDDQIGMLSGIPGGDGGGSATGDRVALLGQEVPVFRTRQTLVVTALLGPPDDPCSYYAVLASGLTLEDYRRLVEGIR